MALLQHTTYTNLAHHAKNLSFQENTRSCLLKSQVYIHLPAMPVMPDSLMARSSELKMYCGLLQRSCRK